MGEMLRDDGSGFGRLREGGGHLVPRSMGRRFFDGFSTSARVLEPAIQDKSRWWSREDLILLVLFGAYALFLPGLGQVPLFDRDEPRFATAARGDGGRQGFPSCRRLMGGAAARQAATLVYWLMNAVHQVTGTWSELTVRLPSAICGTFTLLVVYFMVGKRFGRMTALLAALMLGSCGTFVAESRLATADATMLFFVVVCMSCAWRACGRRSLTSGFRGGVAWGFWVAWALGALTKGVPLIFVLVPMAVLSIATGAMAAHVKQWRSHLHVTGMRAGIAVGIGVVASGILAGTLHVASTELRVWTIVIALLLIGMALTPGLPGVAWRCVMGGNWRWWKQLRPGWGVPLLVVLIGAWVVPAGIRAPDLLKQMVGIHFLQRAAGPLLTWMHINMHALAKAGGNTAVSNYSQPTGFFTVLVWVTFWPWSVLLIPAGYFTWRRLRGRTAIAIDPRPYQFLVAWILPMWVLLELARGKLPHYTLPTYVGLAILCADAMVQSWDRMTDVLAAEVVPGWRVAGAGHLVRNRGGGDRGRAAVSGAGGGCGRAVGFWGAVSLRRRGLRGRLRVNRPGGPFVTVLGWGAALLFMNSVLVPSLGELRVSERGRRRRWKK